MKNVENALSVYTDKLHANEYIDLDELCNGMSKEDLSEFHELKEVIDILWQDKTASKFDKLYDEIWEQMEATCNEPIAANFRKELGTESDRVAEGAIDRLFDEVFKEDE